jgi:pyruvate/2-oxoacid:ferredoxin oxidoreductase beta subunit
MSEARTLTPKDFESDQEIRWCPGCGDYSILAQMKKVLPGLGVAPENTVFVRPRTRGRNRVEADPPGAQRVGDHR